MNATGYGLGDTVREAIDAYRDAVRPGTQIDQWTVGIAQYGDAWVRDHLGNFDTVKGGDIVVFDLDLR